MKASAKAARQGRYLTIFAVPVREYRFDDRDGANGREPNAVSRRTGTKYAVQANLSALPLGAATASSTLTADLISRLSPMSDNSITLAGPQRTRQRPAAMSSSRPTDAR